MKLLKFDTVHPKDYLRQKKENSRLQIEKFSYEEYLDWLINLRSNYSDFFTYNLRKYGWKGAEFITNDFDLIRKGIDQIVPTVGTYKLEENEALKLKFIRDLIKAYKPDVIIAREQTGIASNFWNQFRENSLLMGVMSCPMPNPWYVGDYDVLITSTPIFRDFFQASGTPSYLIGNGFDERILNELTLNGCLNDVVFVGGLGAPVFTKRTQLMEYISRNIAFKWWGYGIERLDNSCKLKHIWQGHASGLDMFNIFNQAHIVLNDYGREANGLAVNQRIYEVMGIGSFMLTRHSPNLTKDFPSGIFATYHNKKDCLEKIKYFLINEKERNEIAEAGQKFVLEHFSYKNIMGKLHQIIIREFEKKFRKKLWSNNSNCMIDMSCNERNGNDAKIENSMGHFSVTSQENNTISVSVIVSTFNSERFIQGCLEDLETQTIFDKLEIIVVNSGSKQNEDRIIREFQKKHSNIKYIRTKNRETVYQAWNRGIMASSGTYITNANTDDRLHPEALTRLAQSLEARSDVDIVYADSLITETENSTWINTNAKRIFKWPDYNCRLLFDICFLGPSPMWRRSLHTKYGYFDERYKSAGDYEFWLRVAKHGVKMLHLRKTLSLYLENPISVSLSDASLTWNESELARNKHWPSKWGIRPPTRWQSFEKKYKPVGNRDIPSKVFKQKILIACDYFLPSVGGVELYIADLAEKLYEQGFHVEIASRWLPERKLTKYQGLQMHQYKCDQNLNAPLTIQEIKRFRFLILNGGFETIIVLTQPDNWVGVSIVDLPNPHPQIILLPSINKDNMIEWEQNKGKPVIAKILQSADKLVAVSETGYDTRFFQSADLEYHFIPHAVDQNASTDDFYLTYGFDADRPHLVMVANFWPVKNHLALLKHMAKLEGNWQLAIIGHPVPHLKEYYNRVVSQAKKDSRVRIIGGLAREQAASAIRDADLLLVPSKGESAGPLVVLQAMSYGTPWIATPECNAVHKEAGGVVAELSMFSSIINYLLDHEKERNELGRLGQVHWLLSFTWEKTISSFIKLIENNSVSPVPEKTEEILYRNKLIQKRVFDEKIDNLRKKKKLSVIIPTYNRSSQIKKCLDALGQQTLPADDFEVVVCDDGSTDDIADMIRCHQAQYDLHYIHQSNRGAGAARNTGIKKSCGQIILFINDDVYLDKDALEQHIRAHESFGKMKVAVLGHIDFVPKYSNWALSKAYTAFNLLFPYTDLNENTNYDFDYFVTGNLSISRDAFYIENEWFDEDFHKCYCEDIELGYRLWKRGYWVYYHPSANAIHDHYISIDDYITRESLNAINLLKFLTKHFELISRYLGVSKLTEEIYKQWREEVEFQSSQISDIIKEIKRIDNANHSMRQKSLPNDGNSIDLANTLGKVLQQISGFLKRKTIVQIFDEYPDLRNKFLKSAQFYPKTPNNNTPVISVVIPCYNYGPYLVEAVESVIGQTFQKFEIIIVNDGSTDNTAEVAESLITKYPSFQIRLIYQKNSGQPAISRNRGISEANGKYILCLDADDMIKPTMLEKCLSVLVQNRNIGIVYTDRLDFGITNQTVRAKNYDFSQLKYANHISYCALYRKEMWDKIGGYRSNIKGCEDWDLWIAAGAKGFFGHYISEPLFMYRRHDTGVFQEVLESYDTKIAQIIFNNREIYTEFDLKRATKLLGKGSQLVPDIFPTVSVIVPTLNRPKMLKEALKSILDQTYQHFEIIVINDGGEDVLESIRNFQDHRIKYIQHEKNKGAAAARNTGIKKASGQFIALLDDDDIFFPEHLELALKYLCNGLPVVYTDAIRASYEGYEGTYKLLKKNVPYSIDFGRDKLLVGNISPINCFVFKKNLAFKAGLFDDTLGTLEDWEFWIRLSALTPFKHIAQPTVQVNWRNDGTTVTSSRGSEFRKNREKIYRKYQNELNKIPNKKEILKEFQKIWAEDWKVEPPLTSIIILTHNQLEFTEKCVNSIIKHTTGPYEIIFVDNGSSDPTCEYLNNLVNSNPNFHLIANNHNKGFAAGNNQGIAAAKGDYILLMNNDIVVTPRWLEQMLACAERDPRIGIVGPMSNYVSGPQLVNDVTYNTTTLEGLNDFAADFSKKNACKIKRLLRVVGFCMLIKRAVIDKIGGLDSSYGSGNFEDDDFSLRAALAGFESWMAEDSYIHHFGNRTFIGANIDYRESLTSNWEIFKNKWSLPIDLPLGAKYNWIHILNGEFIREKHHIRIDQNNSINEGQKNMPSLVPGDNASKAFYQKIQQLVGNGSQEEAIAGLEKLLEMDPDFAAAHNDLGVLYCNQGVQEKALKYYERAIQLDPHNLNFQKNLADFYFVKSGRIEDALTIYNNLLKIDPGDGEALMSMGLICTALKRPEDAKHFYTRVLENEPGNVDARQQLANL